MDDKEKIIQFEPPQQFDIQRKLHKHYACRHVSLVLDEARRIIKCKNCDLCVEPYDYIERVAKKELNVRLDITHLTDKKKHLLNQVKELEKKRNNLQAQIKRREKKLNLI